MLFQTHVVALLASFAAAATHNRLPLSYNEIPENIYKVPVPNDTITLLDLVHSRPELSKLAGALDLVPGTLASLETRGRSS
jgi:hypothetical protein